MSKPRRGEGTSSVAGSVAPPGLASIRAALPRLSPWATVRRPCRADAVPDPDHRHVLPAPLPRPPPIPPAPPGTGPLFPDPSAAHLRAALRDKPRALTDKLTTVADAVARLVRDGDYLAIGGFGCDRLPTAVVHEVVRQRKQ